MKKIHRSAVLVGALALTAVLVAPAQARTTDGFKLGGVECSLIEVPQAGALAPPFGIGSCPGVRPGAVVESDRGSCTFNFLFTGADGSRYMGTAGHCILGESQFVEEIGEKTWAPGTGPEARDGAGRRIGEFAYAILLSPKDFALVRLDPGVAADPQMCHFGGPTAINTQRSGSGLVHHRGNGIVFGDVVPARSSYVSSFSDPNYVFAHGPAAPGDSGGGVITPDGAAVGALVSLSANVSGVIGITRLEPQLAQAERTLGTDLTLVTAPLL